MKKQKRLGLHQCKYLKKNQNLKTFKKQFGGFFFIVKQSLQNKIYFVIFQKILCHRFTNRKKEPKKQEQMIKDKVIKLLDAKYLKIQIYCALIANLLMTVVQKRLKRCWSFSNLVCFCRIHLFNYIHLLRFLENPERDWLKYENNIEQLTLF